jgi:DNA polymerase/3'-5' exonuclease PolX
MSSSTKRPYAEMLSIAESVTVLLWPACERILIAGSLRRHKATIGDIEIVAMPKTEAEYNLFGEVVGEASLLEAMLSRLDMHFTKNGPRYKQWTLPDGTQVDLFIATPETWGCVATIRTGSMEFSKSLMTSRRHGGRCPSHLKFKEGRIWNGGTALDTPEEKDVFAALGIDWIDPVWR